MKTNTFLITLLILLFFSCTKNDAVPVKTETEAKTIMNVPYGNDAQQQMDIYLPANRSTSQTKVLVLVHGGGWAGGSKEDFNGELASIKNTFPDYAIFNINYRLYANNNNKFPTQEKDVQAAIEFIYSKRPDYAISDKFVLLGASAGGHLVQLQAYKHPSPVKPKAVVTFFGPTDLTALYQSNPLLALILLAPPLGGTPDQVPAIYQEGSPINYITAQAPPTIILQGAQDPIVPKAQADILQAKLQNVNVPNQLVLYPGAGHGWSGADLQDSYTKISAFLALHVK